MKRLVAVAVLLFGCAPASTVSTPVPTTPTASPTQRVEATPSPAPTTTRGSALVPPIGSRAQYGDIQISLDVPDRPGQPAEGVVWKAAPFKPDAGYAGRVAAALGVTGAGTLGAIPAGGAPGSNGPWRVWLGTKTLAVNEATGEVYYFDPAATDGTPPPGAARRDPADLLQALLGSFGWKADLEPTAAGITAFRGTEVAIRADPVIHGQWLDPGYREAAALFPNYPDNRFAGMRVYGTDHIALLTANGRPAQLVHRPIAGMASGEIYPITTLGAARRELLSAPQRYLRFLSNPTGDALKLTFVDAYLGSAWAGFASSGMTHGGEVLVPAWIFTAKGSSAGGTAVDAIFVVDAVVPELRAQGVGGTTNTNADTLLSLQLAILGGQGKELLTPQGAVRYFLAPSCEPTLTTQDADTANGSYSCGGAAVTFTVRRAYPGLASSIWFVSESRK